MTIGALIDAGLPLVEIQSELEKLGLTGYTLTAQKVLRAGISATKFDVILTAPSDAPNESHHGRSLTHINQMIERSSLSTWVKERALLAFTRLGDVEAKIHQQSIEKVHFHEVGAIDSIVDIVGALIGMEKFGIKHYLSAPVNVGRGFVHTEHGVLPVPAPATAELLRQAPTYAHEIEGELTTPTGAALLATLVERYGPQPPMRVQQIGYGAGRRVYPSFPNVLRLLVGEADAPAVFEGNADEAVAVIEANIDDMSPQLYAHFMEKALQMGALDIFLTSVQMKKNRPGVLLSVITPPALREAITELVFLETTTIGVRYTIMPRKTLSRVQTPVETPYGRLRVKTSMLGSRIMNYAPEYEDCRQAAERCGVPLKEVFATVNKTFLEKEIPAWKTR
ncbi:MAG: nickel pincer cofactor biosynthesis protein LarC [Acidobacteria bacterium]|nr:nickel pincer cofactor biosynthesis protein LarC [Acidobacteriota bacterium]MBI3658467.1 nickel pincer cofactor biosynthesis protein LarC [Acidobacteriota bacterium]